jgi:hypothetical protein
MIGHLPSIAPYAVQSMKPPTVMEYIPTEMLSVSRVRIILTACGMKLSVESTAAALPTAAVI